MLRTTLILSALLGLTRCDVVSEPTVDCSAELQDVHIEAYSGQVQSDGSVTVYGTIQFASGDSSTPDGGAELTVRSVYVAGQQVAQPNDGFNYRSWTVTLTQDRLAAYAAGSGQAHVPDVAYLYGGCYASLPTTSEPVVPVKILDASADHSLQDAKGGS
jgi:hypothetical protein